MKKIIKIDGMHCISCEIVLGEELEKISGINLIMISHKNGILEIEYEDEKKFDKVKKIIKEKGYEIIEGEEEIKKNKEKNKISLETILNNFAIFLGIIVFIYLFSIFDIFRFLPNTNTLNYSGAFLIGIIASLSTCLAVTGGIIIGFSRYLDSKKGLSSHIKIQGLFQLGRISGFFIFGGILGYVGKIFQISFGITGILTFIIGFILLYLGLNIIGLVPSITEFGFHLPIKFGQKISKAKDPKFAPLIGAMTFFLPCGFTQSMQLLAISSSGFLEGGMIMLIFALGTFPVLFTIGVGSSYFKEKKFVTLNKIIGVLVIFLGIFTISNSYNLISFNSVKNYNNIVKAKGEVETINVGYNGSATEPSIINLKAGKNYKIIVTPNSDGIGCMTTQVIPKLSNKISYVKKGIPIVYDINDAKPGIYNIVCSAMGMEQGKIVVN